MTIWKYALPLRDLAEVSMPAHARIIHVGTQNEAPFLWAVVDPAAPHKIRHLRVAGTGHPLGNVGPYVGSFMLGGGAPVFHVFEMPT